MHVYFISYICENHKVANRITTSLKQEHIIGNRETTELEVESNLLFREVRELFKLKGNKYSSILYLTWHEDVYL